MNRYLSSLGGENNTLHWCSLLWLPGCLSSKESACNAGDTGSIPGLERSEGNGNSVFLLGKSHGQRSLAGYSPCGHNLVSDYPWGGGLEWGKTETQRKLKSQMFWDPSGPLEQYFTSGVKMWVLRFHNMVLLRFRHLAQLSLLLTLVTETGSRPGYRKARLCH